MAAEREALNAQFGALELDRWIVTSPLPNPPPPPPSTNKWFLFVSNAIGGQVQGTPVYGYFFHLLLCRSLTIRIAGAGVKVSDCSSI